MTTTIITPATPTRPATVGPSILRMSALQRLIYAGALIALLWAAVFWAMRMTRSAAISESDAGV